MKLEVLMSCMHQQNDALVCASDLTGDVVMVNQCDHDGYAEYETPRGLARMFSTRERGLTKSRNLAIEQSRADICMLCDDDEVFAPDYERQILEAYEMLPQADVIVFKINNWPVAFADEVRRLRFPLTMKVSSVQISFRREALMRTGIRFDPLLGAGSGNGAEEELKFLLDCERAGLMIYYVPAAVASVAQEASTWFGGFNETFFENRGATTRYILGWPLACAYALYYVARKRSLYEATISPAGALRATLRGIRKNKIRRQAQSRKETKPVHQ